jgi:outer membrane protein OmpA-like peptidoglycan-associated protein
MQFLLIILILMPVSVFGQSVRHDENTSAQEIIKKLTPPTYKNAESALLFRGLALKNKKQKAPSIDLHIPFDFNSATLTPRAQKVVAQIAEALKSQNLKNYQFEIAGHTDSVGETDYNMHLSLSRAKAVSHALEKIHGIAANRLKNRGFGESRLLKPMTPEDEENRRVQVTNLGDL